MSQSLANRQNYKALRDRLWRATAPRKLVLTLEHDRELARLSLMSARSRCRKLGIRGYDRILLVAAIMAQESGLAWLPTAKDHVSRILAQAALD